MSSHNVGISKNITKRKSVTFIPKDPLGLKNSTTNLNAKTKQHRKSVISTSTIASPSKSNSSGKTKKSKIKISTTTLKVEKLPSKPSGRRGSYCDLFKLKQSYVSNDFSLTQKPETGYSILYKDGVRVFEDVEKSNNVNNSIRSSFLLSNNRSKNSLSPNRKIRRRGSVEASFNRKYTLLAEEKKDIDDYLKSIDNKLKRRKSVEMKGTSGFYKHLLGKNNESSSSSSSSISSSSSNNSSNLSRKNSLNMSVKSSFKGEKIEENEIKKKIDKKKNFLKSSFKRSFNSNEKRKSIK